MTEEERVMESIRIDLKWAGEMDKPPPWLVEDRLRKGKCPKCAAQAVQRLDGLTMDVVCGKCGILHFEMGAYEEIILNNPFNKEMNI